MSTEKKDRTEISNPGIMKGRGPMGGRGGPMGGPGAMMPGEKAGDFKGSMKSLISYLQKYLPKIAIVILFAIFSTLFGVVAPMLLGKITTNIFSGPDFNFIIQMLVFLIVLYVASSLFSWLQGFLMTSVTMDVSFRLRNEIEAKLHRLPLGFFDTTAQGEVLSCITNDVDTVTQSLNQSVTQIITSITSLLGILVMMLWISWEMTLSALIVLPVSFFFVQYIVKKSQPHFRAQQGGLARVNGHIQEMYSNHIVMKAFGGEKASVLAFEKYNDALYNSVWKAQFFSGLMMPLMKVIGNLGYVVVCILGGYLAVHGRLAVGNIQAFIQYVRQFNQPVTQIANISNVLQSMAAASERIFAFLGEKEESLGPVNPLPSPVVKGDVAFEHVRFGYSPEKTIIRDFSAKVTAGQKIAIVGPTGAGKTTIVKLLMRFYDLDSGAILIDGVDMALYTRKGIRSSFGMVLQDTWLYNASIRENIRYGKLDATDEEVVSAAISAQVDHFVRTLPDGYDFFLNEDASNISRGQKQLLTIARAILADPEILILDEATSSVDTLTEVLIQKAMDNLMLGRTSFVIAHRLSTIRNADLILVLQDGDIVEQGAHEDLLAQNGAYAKLYQSQFEVKEELLA
ncbi:MAG TPA: ABC transporter ATP-binding protein [Treponemataceae bacterium]|nr:ABC transporter ATP-binding protein [Treponemataceae bacterium]